MQHAQGSTPQKLSARGLKALIVGSRWNQELTDALVKESESVFLSFEGSAADIEIIRVPGAFEIPLAIQLATKAKDYDLVVSVGVIIEGATPHFDKLCADITDKISYLILNQSLPIGFGVVMAHTLAQAQERCLVAEHSKGREAMLAAVEMAQLKKLLSK